MARKAVGLSPLVLVLAATALVLVPVFWNGFVFDDLYVFIAADRIHELANIPSFFLHNTLYVTEQQTPVSIDTYRPMTLASFAIDSAFTGRNPLGYHVTNLLLHLLNVSLVYAIAQRLMAEENRRYAWLAAAWFGLSPWIGEAHIWINGRSDPLCTAFALSGLLLWDRAITSARTWAYALSGLLFFGALLSKEVGMGVLPALLLWPRLSSQRPTWPGRAKALWAPCLAGMGYLWVRASVLGSGQSHRDLSQLFAATRNFGILFFDGLVAAFVPSPPYLRSLSDAYASLSPSLLWLLTALAMGLLLSAVVLRRRQPSLSWSLIFFALTLAPVVVITVQNWPGFGRYLYLPIAGLSAGIVDSLATQLRKVSALRRPRTKRILAVALTAYLGLLAVLLHRFTYDFANDGALYGSVIESAPDSGHGYGYLGLSLLGIRQNEEAVRYLREALERDPRQIIYRTGLANALIASDRREEAVALLEGWMDDSPKDEAASYFAFITQALMDSDPDRTVAAAQTCLRINPHAKSCREQLQALGGTRP